VCRALCTCKSAVLGRSAGSVIGIGCPQIRHIPSGFPEPIRNETAGLRARRGRERGETGDGGYGGCSDGESLAVQGAGERRPRLRSAFGPAEERDGIAYRMSCLRPPRPRAARIRVWAFGSRPRCRLIAVRPYDIILDVLKQLLLRVPEDVHRRLAARARREGRSVNAVATEILDAAAAGDQGDRRARLRAAAAAAGTLRSVDARSVSAARRRRIVGSTRGLGAQVDRLLAEERERV
jgi:plasmid stability protein